MISTCTQKAAARSENCSFLPPSSTKVGLIRLTCVSQELLNQGQLVLCPLNVWIDGFDILRRSQTRHIFQCCPCSSSTASRVPHNYFTAITTSVKASSVSKKKKKGVFPLLFQRIKILYQPETSSHICSVVPAVGNMGDRWAGIRRVDVYPFNSGQSSGFCRGLASATAARVFRSNRWRSCITRLVQSTTCYSRVSATRWIFSARLGGKTRIKLILSIAAYRRRPKSAKYHVACGLTLKASSVSRGFAVGGQKVVSVFLPRWPKQIFGTRQTLCATYCLHWIHSSRTFSVRLRCVIKQEVVAINVLHKCVTSQCNIETRRALWLK